jgi:uncharacterized membrane protein
VLILADPHNEDTKESEKTWYFWAMFNAAALLYLTIFTELILFWTRMLDSMEQTSQHGAGDGGQAERKRRVVQLVVLLMAWGGYCGVFALYFFVDFYQFALIEDYVTAGFFAVSAVFFAVYGTLIYRRVFLQMVVRSPAVLSRIRRVLAVAIIMTIAFLARAVLNAIVPSIMLGVNIPENIQFVLFTFVFIVLEAIPLFLVEILIILPQKISSPNDLEQLKDVYTIHYSQIQND